MSALPPQFQRYAAQGQRPTLSAEVELYEEADPIVHVPDPYNPTGFVAVRRSVLVPATPTPLRDLTPQPLFDPQAQRFIGAGVGIGAAGAGLGYGAGQMFAGVALMGTSGLAILLGLLLAAGARGRTVVHQRHETHVTQKWFGRADVTHTS